VVWLESAGSVAIAALTVAAAVLPRAPAPALLVASARVSAAALDAWRLLPFDAWRLLPLWARRLLPFDARRFLPLRARRLLPFDGRLPHLTRLTAGRTLRSFRGLHPLRLGGALLRLLHPFRLLPLLTGWGHFTGPLRLLDAAPPALARGVAAGILRGSRLARRLDLTRA